MEQGGVKVGAAGFNPSTSSVIPEPAALQLETQADQKRDCMTIKREESGVNQHPCIYK